MPHFGVVNYSDQALANVLSFSATRTDYEITYDVSSDTFTVNIAPTVIFLFVNKGGLYVCDMSTFVQRRAVAAVVTVQDNMSKFSKREIAGAENARELMRQLGYPSSRDMMDLIKSGGIMNSSVTAQDVYRASQIFGSDIASLKGKTVTVKSEGAKLESIPKPMSSPCILISCLLNETHTLLLFLPH
jgi:predicted lactoylglutathione lyase